VTLFKLLFGHPV